MMASRSDLNVIASPMGRHRHTLPTRNGLLNQSAEGFSHHDTV
jgi:hypothetical protein